MKVTDLNFTVLNTTEARVLEAEYAAMPLGTSMGVRLGPSGVSEVDLAKAFGRSWRIMFCPTDQPDVIWTCTSSRDVQTDGLSLSYYVDQINEKRPFSFVRYGDMLACVAGTLYEGFGFQRFTPELRADIRCSLLEYHKSPRYIMALAQVYHFRRLGMWGHTARFLFDHNLDTVKWVATETFNHAMYNGHLLPFISALRNTRTLVVGPARLEALQDRVLPNARVMEIPAHQCHAEEADIIRLILAQASELDVITFSAGPAAVTMIWKLFPLIGQHTTMISIGSLWGPFIGVMEHGGHHRLSEETMQRNLGNG